MSTLKSEYLVAYLPILVSYYYFFLEGWNGREKTIREKKKQSRGVSLFGYEVQYTSPWVHKNILPNAHTRTHTHTHIHTDTHTHTQTPIHKT